jgi:solute carrier family 29 (equilibrative nucleoside transporter), member 4
MFTFNTTDVIGKVLAAVPYSWSRRQLILLSSLRTFLIPLLLLCVSPRRNPTISGELPAFIFTAALGVTNGLAGSLPMLLAPSKVDTQHKELSGNIMTISYMSGLTLGSLVGYVFEHMIGPKNPTPCLQYPYIPKPPEEIESTTALIMTTLTNVISTTNATIIQAVPTLISTIMPSSTTTEIDLTTTELSTTIGNLNSSLSTLLNSTSLNEI